MDAPAQFSPPPLEARQYLLTLILLGLGAWCIRDGWFNPDIEHRLFNQIAGPVLIAWAIWDGLRMRRREIAAARRAWERPAGPGTPAPGKPEGA